MEDDTATSIATADTVTADVAVIVPATSDSWLGSLGGGVTHD